MFCNFMCCVFSSRVFTPCEFDAPSYSCLAIWSVISNYGHFHYGTLHLSGQFTYCMVIRPLDTKPTGHLAYKTALSRFSNALKIIALSLHHLQDTSPTGQFVNYLNISPTSTRPNLIGQTSCFTSFTV